MINIGDPQPEPEMSGVRRVGNKLVFDVKSTTDEIAAIVGGLCGPLAKSVVGVGRGEERRASIVVSPVGTGIAHTLGADLDATEVETIGFKYNIIKYTFYHKFCAKYPVPFVYKNRQFNDNDDVYPAISNTYTKSTGGLVLNAPEEFLIQNVWVGYIGDIDNCRRFTSGKVVHLSVGSMPVMHTPMPLLTTCDSVWNQHTPPSAIASKTSGYSNPELTGETYRQKDPMNLCNQMRLTVDISGDPSLPPEGDAAYFCLTGLYARGLC